FALERLPQACGRSEDRQVQARQRLSGRAWITVRRERTDSAMKKTVVYILSTPYAGSHFLSLQLGSHSKTMHVGELKILRKGPPKENQRECRFELGEVFQGIGPENIDQVYDIIFSRIDPGIEALI